jgi:hypothetical protein
MTALDGIAIPVPGDPTIALPERRDDHWLFMNGRYINASNHRQISSLVISRYE